jgi:hypothetical protein
MVFGYLLTMMYDVLKFAAVGARWAGWNWDTLSTDIARPLASVASLFIATGFCVPLVVQRFSPPLKEWTRFRKLGPLWYSMRDLVLARGDTRSPLLTSVGMRLLQRERDIHDALLTLNPYFPADVRSSVRDCALAAGASERDADAEADAAMILAALEAFRKDPDHSVISSSQELQTGVGIEPHNLTRISHAIRHSPIGTAHSIAAQG